MHIARFSLNDRIHWGIVEGDEVRDIEGDLYGSPHPGQRLCALSDARLLAPIDAHANKVVAIAANYGDRAGRDGPGIFMKQPGTVIGLDDSIIYPRIGRRIIHEAEVGIVIGKQARHVSVGNALDYVLGYTCVNDVSANELTNSDIGAGMSLRWKHFDTFCPLGPVIATDIDGDNLRIQCRVNGETQVDGNSANMLWGVAELVSWVSDVMTLYPGDIIPSGCPGVDEINIGDMVEVEVEGIGILRNPVIADSA
jgi:2-keto-4-pentenoate hydratase/2-oxohepta-3-ene-1,7-dioic acid hydratase in catechol pathway